MGPDVILINPAPLHNPGLKRPSVEKYPYPPLGLLSIAGVLRMHGYRVEIIDFFREEFTSRSQFTARLKSFSQEPLLVGISTYTATFADAALISRAVRQACPETTIVLGGSHATFCHEEILRSHSEIDFIVRGEGEATIVELLQALREPGSLPLSLIDGLSYLDASGALKTTAARSYITSLDCLPLPPYEMLPSSATAWGYNIFVLLTSRGCPGSCIFCASRSFSGSRYRMHSAEWLISLVYLNAQEVGFSAMNVLDDTFVADVERLERFCDYLAAAGMRVAWSCKSRVDTITDRVLDCLERANCKSVHIGVESADDGVLRSIAKGVTVEAALDAIARMKRRGIRADCSFIIGNHSDTPVTMEKTLLLADALGSHRIGNATIGVCTPFPGTRLYTHADRLGIHIVNRDWRHYDLHTALFYTDNMSIAEVQQAQFRFDVGSVSESPVPDCAELQEFRRVLDDFIMRCRERPEGVPS